MFFASSLYLPGSHSRTRVFLLHFILSALRNSIITRFASFRGVVLMYVIRLAANLKLFADVSHSFFMSQGIIMEIVPSCVSRPLAALKNASLPKLSLCRASVRDVLSHLRLLTKYGGLLTIVSNIISVAYLSKSQFIISMRLFHGELLTFSLACIAAASSISIPVIRALHRCAAIIAMSPLPVPISRMRQLLMQSNQPPNRQPSVPTFMAHPPCSIVNCLNLK